MGIKERKARNREDFKQRILEAAIKLFTKDGYEATSIRKIAAEIEFSPTTIYLYYKDKSDIIYALHQEGFRQMGERFSSLDKVDNAFERLKAMGRAYIQFGIDRPEFYELMFVMQEPLKYLDIHCKEGKEWKEGHAVFGSLLDTIRACQLQGYFKGQHPDAIALMVWSTVHGLCGLVLHGHLRHISLHKKLFEDETQALNVAFESFIQILEKTK